MSRLLAHKLTIAQHLQHREFNDISVIMLSHSHDITRPTIGFYLNVKGKVKGRILL